MKKILFMAFAAVALASCCCGGDEVAKEPLPEGITKALDYYVGGSPTADSTITANGFHASATMSWSEGGKLQCVPISSLFEFVASSPMSAEYTVEDYSVAGDVAMVRISSKFGDTEYTDMFTLVKDGADWKIVSKVYSTK